MLRTSLNSLGKVGDSALVSLAPGRIEFQATNPSKTITALIEFHFLDTLGDPATTEKVKAKALEFAFSSLDIELFSACKLKFARTSSGANILVVDVELHNSETKTYQLPCLDFETNESNVVPKAPVSSPFAFACTLAIMQNILSQCSQTSEFAEIEFELESGFTFRSLRNTQSRESSLDTVVQMPLSAFTRIYVHGPWRARMRIKEFRSMISLYSAISMDTFLTCRFAQPGSAMSFYMSCPGGELEGECCFSFMTSGHPIPHNEVQVIDLGTRPVSRGSRNGSRIEDEPVSLHRGLPRLETRPIETKQPTVEVRSAPLQETEVVDLLEIVEGDEIGATPDASQAEGLF